MKAPGDEIDVIVAVLLNKQLANNMPTVCLAYNDNQN
jgi:hypothetical protein